MVRSAVYLESQHEFFLCCTTFKWILYRVLLFQVVFVSSVYWFTVSWKWNSYCRSNLRLWNDDSISLQNEFSYCFVESEYRLQWIYSISLACGSVYVTSWAQILKTIKTKNDQTRVTRRLKSEISGLLFPHYLISLFSSHL